MWRVGEELDGLVMTKLSVIARKLCTGGLLNGHSGMAGLV